MIRGLDTTFLVEVEVREHPGHDVADATLTRLLDDGDTFALAPQVLTEFVHVVTDPPRFEQPLSVVRALSRAERWWTAREVRPVFPDGAAVKLFAGWVREHDLGRKRLLDTMLAATYRAAGIASVVTTNARDFRVFGCFDVVVPA